LILSLGSLSSVGEENLNFASKWAFKNNLTDVAAKSQTVCKEKSAR